MNDFISEQIPSSAKSEVDFNPIAINPSANSDDKTALNGNENGATNTLRRVLSSYEIGFKLRQLRLKKKIALVDLGRHTGLSASMLSQLENGKLIPTLPTLAKIALVFNVGLEHFFAERRQQRTFTIVRVDERLRFPDRADSPVPGCFFEVLAFGSSEKGFSAYLAHFPKTAATEAREHMHEGSEFIHVLEGELAINYQAEEHTLRAGDSVYFDGTEAHSYFGRSDVTTKAIVITTLSRL